MPKKNRRIATQANCEYISQAVQDFFKQNYLGELFTQPCTPQENGHIEKFHAILSRSVTNQTFATLEHLHKYDDEFYGKCKDRCVQSSTACLVPTVVKHNWEAGNISVEEDAIGKQKFRLKVPIYTLVRRLGLSVFRITYAAE